MPLNPTRSIEHRLALRRRIVVSFCGDRIVDRRFDADQRSAVVPCFAISVSCRESGTKWFLTLIHFPDMAPSIAHLPAKNGYIAPAFRWLQAIARARPYRFAHGRSGAVISILPRALIAGLAQIAAPPDMRNQSLSEEPYVACSRFLRDVSDECLRSFFPTLSRRFSYILFRAAPIPLERFMA